MTTLHDDKVNSPDARIYDPVGGVWITRDCRPVITSRLENRVKVGCLKVSNPVHGTTGEINLFVALTEPDETGPVVVSLTQLMSLRIDLCPWRGENRYEYLKCPTCRDEAYSLAYIDGRDRDSVSVVARFGPVKGDDVGLRSEGGGFAVSGLD